MHCADMLYYKQCFDGKTTSRFARFRLQGFAASTITSQPCPLCRDSGLPAARPRVTLTLRANLRAAVSTTGSSARWWPPACGPPASATALSPINRQGHVA